MFVYVRLIDSQEHQYPNKKPDPNIQEKPKTKIQKNHRPIKPGIQDPKKNREKTNVLKTKFLNHSIKANKIQIRP
jgi:hypothetical protein